jgi:hypothetical protein
MGFLSKLFGKSEKKSDPIKLNCPGKFSVNVVGESHYQEHIANICGGRTENSVSKLIEAQLVPEDTNQYDKNAVRVDISGKPVGYLSRNDASQFRRWLFLKGQKDVKATCMALISGGWSRPGGDVGNFGITLDLPKEFERFLTETQTQIGNTDNSTNAYFWIENPVLGELAECHVGDYVKFWIPKDDPDRIFIYRKGSVGGTGKLGFVPFRHAQIISQHLSKGLVCETEILSVENNKCQIRYRLVSKDETEEKKEVSREKLRAELTEKYTPQKPLKVTIDSTNTQFLKIGEKLRIEFSDLNYYVKNPQSWNFILLTQTGLSIGPKSINASSMKKLLKAHFNGYSFNIEVLTISQKINEYCNSPVELLVTPYKE